jgi:protocatechuate 3,4-dioxygenase beta subunit
MFATTVITILCSTLLLTCVTFVTLSETFFAEGTNTNQTSTSLQSQPNKSITSCKLTESAAQGAEYKTGAPFKQGKDFAKGLKGHRIELSGKVLKLAGCKPVQGAVLEIWQTNSSGDYDNKGFNLRGKIVTDKDGKYVLHTVSPGRLHLSDNTTRPSHIHVMVGIPNQPTIVTQLYFDVQPGDYDMDVEDVLIPKLVSDEDGIKKMNFDFVVEYYKAFDTSKG